MSSNDGNGHREFEGYSDYRTVSNRVGGSIDQAIDSYATLAALHGEGARVRPQMAAEARRDIEAAALKLLPELEANEDATGGDGDDEAADFYADVLERWQGDDGYLAELREQSLQDECPDWLYKFVTDIRRVGWEIGYLKAGRVTSEPDLEPDERAAAEMFE